MRYEFRIITDGIDNDDDAEIVKDAIWDLLEESKSPVKGDIVKITYEEVIDPTTKV